jgi:hypothetical protein
LHNAHEAREGWLDVEGTAALVFGAQEPSLPLHSVSLNSLLVWATRLAASGGGSDDAKVKKAKM